MNLHRGFIIGTVCWVLASGVARAQHDLIPSRTIEVSFGGSWLGGADLGSATAVLTRNPTMGTDPFTLFATTSHLDANAGFEATLGFHVTRRLAVEGSFTRTRPEVRTTISSDAERPGLVMVASERLSQYVVEARLVVHLARSPFGAHVVPFVEGGGGYLRQLHEGSNPIETGRVGQAGSGVKYVFRTPSRRRLKAIVLRAEGRWYVRDGGYRLSRRFQTFGALQAGAGVLF